LRGIRGRPARDSPRDLGGALDRSIRALCAALRTTFHEAARRLVSDRLSSSRAAQSSVVSPICAHERRRYARCELKKPQLLTWELKVMSQSQKSVDSNGRRRTVALRTPGVAAANAPSARAGDRPAERVPPVWHRPESSSEELFGREPFTYGRVPRYFGTGVPFYQSGPGFTGGYYGYGDEPPEIPTELEREYTHDLYGHEADAQAGTLTRRCPPAIQAMSGAFPGVRRLPKKARKYPP